MYERESKTRTVRDRKKVLVECTVQIQQFSPVEHCNVVVTYIFHNILQFYSAVLQHITEKCILVGGFGVKNGNGSLHSARWSTIIYNVQSRCP